MTNVKYLKCNGCDSADNKYEYPGVYLTLITKHNIDTERFYFGKYKFIFSKDLLLQKNYHANVSDSNGMINEHLTYFPWNIDLLVDKIKSDPIKYNSNEIIFHDNIPMTFCCKRLSDKDKLPRTVMKTKTVPDMDKLPFYAFTCEDGYSGVPKPPKSSLTWFNILAKIAGSTKTYKTKKSCLRFIRKNANYLCKNRDKQHIHFFTKLYKRHIK